jgi:hypothetical protein
LFDLINAVTEQQAKVIKNVGEHDELLVSLQTMVAALNDKEKVIDERDEIIDEQQNAILILQDANKGLCETLGDFKIQVISNISKLDQDVTIVKSLQDQMDLFNFNLQALSNN